MTSSCCSVVDIASNIDAVVVVVVAVAVVVVVDAAAAARSTVGAARDATSTSIATTRAASRCITNDSACSALAMAPSSTIRRDCSSTDIDIDIDDDDSGGGGGGGVGGGVGDDARADVVIVGTDDTVVAGVVATLASCDSER